MALITEDLIDKVYEAAVVPELWDTVLDDVARRVGSVGGLLFAANSQHTNWVGSSIIGPLYADFIKEGLAAKNPRPQRAMAKNHAGLFGIMTCSPQRRWIAIPFTLTCAARG
jgi:hypothetical protein